MNKKKIINELMIIFWIFIIGSILGYIYEMIVVLFKKGYFESRQGLIYGPFTPVYGIGGIIYYLILNMIEAKNKKGSKETAISNNHFGKLQYYIRIFLITAVLGGITEYICSYIQEKAFGTISWDYSYLMFNLNGRTSLMHCTYWGIAGVMYVVFIVPFIQKLKQKIEKSYMKVITIILSIFMIFNIWISCVAAERQEARRNNKIAETALDNFLDEYYPDELMDRVYANKKEIRKIVLILFQI